MSAPALPIRPGDSGPSVEQLQRALTELATETGDMNLDPESTSGTFDATTESAVRILQAYADLGETGVVDEATWTALEARLAPTRAAAETAAEAPDPSSAGIEWVTAPHLADGKIVYRYKVTTNATRLVQENVSVSRPGEFGIVDGQVYEVPGLAPDEEHETHAPIGTGIPDGDYTVEVGAFTYPAGYGHHIHATVAVTIRGEVAYPLGSSASAGASTVRLLSFEVDGGKLTFGYAVSGGAGVDNVYAYVALIHNGARRWSTNERVEDDAQDIVSVAFPADMVEAAGWSLELFITATAVDGTKATCHVLQGLTVTAGAVQLAGDRQLLDN